MALVPRIIDLLTASSLVIGAALTTAACSSPMSEMPPYDREPQLPTDAAPPPRDVAPRVPSDAGSCSAPAAGCPCEVENQAVVCGTVHDQFGDYVRCAPSFMHCISGVWGECAGDRVVGTP